VNLIFRLPSSDDYQCRGGDDMKKMKKAAGKKPANQGSAGKPNTMKPLMAKKASSKGGKTYFSSNPSGTRGSRSK
jgi:hypothetical protein